MINYEQIPFEMKHLEDIELQEWERTHIDPASVAAFDSVGMIWTLKIDGKILAIVGFYEKWKGVFEAVVYPSIHTKTMPTFYVFKVRRSLNLVINKLQMRRVQAVSLSTPAQDKWMRALGFEYEGTLKGYTVEGLDCKMWARVRQ